MSPPSASAKAGGGHLPRAGGPSRWQQGGPAGAVQGDMPTAALPGSQRMLEKPSLCSSVPPRRTVQGMQNSKPPLTGAMKSNGPRGPHASRGGPASPAGRGGCRTTWAAGPEGSLGYISGVYATAQDAQEQPRGWGRGPCLRGPCHWGSKSCSLSRAHCRRNPGPGSVCPAQEHGTQSECPSQATGILHNLERLKLGALPFLGSNTSKFTSCERKIV